MPSPRLRVSATAGAAYDVLQMQGWTTQSPCHHQWKPGEKKKKGPLWIGSLLRIRLRYFGELNAVQAQRLRRPLKDSDQRSGTDGSGQNTPKRVLPVEKGDVERWGHAQTDSQMLHACSSARWW